MYPLYLPFPFATLFCYQLEAMCRFSISGDRYFLALYELYQPLTSPRELAHFTKKRFHGQFPVISTSQAVAPMVTSSLLTIPDVLG